MSREDLAAYMESLVLEYYHSGQTRKAFAAAHGISLEKLIYWIKKMSKSGKLPKTGGKAPRRSGSNFVPLKLGMASSSRDQLLILLPSGVEIQIPL